ncbi:MAG: hypothetical protein M0Z41_14210 [Peptococcaceae bacterium]|jgi:hypothetical protein|nr:hypothetical protein [Peptococcaceae bacterium]
MSDGLAAVVEKALGDPEFLLRVVADPEGVLAAEGITVSPEEKEAIREFAARFAGGTPAEASAAVAAAVAERKAAFC